MGIKSNKDGSSGQFRDYPAAALYLAQTYGNMLKQQEYYDKVLSGKAVYTEDDALDELISTTASTESDTGIRVQTSNISNTTERIGLLLANGFVEKRSREILREALNNGDERQYIAWKLDVINTAMTERMQPMERNIFKRMYGKGMTYQQIREAYHKRVLYDKAINKHRKTALSLLEAEIRMRDEDMPEDPNEDTVIDIDNEDKESSWEADMMDRLFAEIMDAEDTEEG